MQLVLHFNISVGLIQITFEDQLSYQLADYKLYAKDEVFELYNIKNDPYEN